MTEAPPCPPHHPPQPLADRQRLRRRHRHAQGLRWCALLAALAAIAAPGAWARAAAAKPASVASPPAAASAASAAAPAGSAGSAVAAAAAPAARSTARFGFYGLSPAQAGQALAQAETALGQPLTAEAAAKPLKPVAADSAANAANAANAAAAGCHYRSTAQQPGVRYALAGAVITRIETRDPRYATFSGVHVGDSLARAQQAYGQRLVSAPHPYFDQGRMLTVYSPNRRFALVMETNDGGRIITLRGGRLPDVGWLEGCS